MYHCLNSPLIYDLLFDQLSSHLLLIISTPSPRGCVLASAAHIQVHGIEFPLYSHVKLPDYVNFKISREK